MMSKLSYPGPPSPPPPNKKEGKRKANTKGRRTHRVLPISPAMDQLPISGGPKGFRPSRDRFCCKKRQF